MTVLQAAA